MSRVRIRSGLLGRCCIGNQTLLQLFYRSICYGHTGCVSGLYPAGAFGAQGHQRPCGCCSRRGCSQASISTESRRQQSKACTTSPQICRGSTIMRSQGKGLVILYDPGQPYEFPTSIGVCGLFLCKGQQCPHPKGECQLKHIYRAYGGNMAYLEKLVTIC